MKPIIKIPIATPQRLEAIFRAFSIHGVGKVSRCDLHVRVMVENMDPQYIDVATSSGHLPNDP